MQSDIEAEAVRLLRAAFTEADYLGRSCASEDGIPRVFLLVSIDQGTFTHLCNFGAEIEDLEPEEDCCPVEDVGTSAWAARLPGASEDDEIEFLDGPRLPEGAGGLPNDAFGRGNSWDLTPLDGVPLPPLPEGAIPLGKREDGRITVFVPIANGRAAA